MYFILANIVDHDQSERNEDIETAGERKRKKAEDTKKEERKGRKPLDCLAVVIPAF